MRGAGARTRPRYDNVAMSLNEIKKDQFSPPESKSIISPLSIDGKALFMAQQYGQDLKTLQERIDVHRSIKTPSTLITGDDTNERKALSPTMMGSNVATITALRHSRFINNQFIK